MVKSRAYSASRAHVPIRPAILLVPYPTSTLFIFTPYFVQQIIYHTILSFVSVKWCFRAVTDFWYHKIIQKIDESNKLA